VFRTKIRGIRGSVFDERGFPGRGAAFAVGAGGVKHSLWMPEGNCWRRKAQAGKAGKAVGTGGAKHILGRPEVLRARGKAAAANSVVKAIVANSSAKAAGEHSGA